MFYLVCLLRGSALSCTCIYILSKIVFTCADHIHGIHRAYGIHAFCVNSTTMCVLDGQIYIHTEKNLFFVRQSVSFLLLLSVTSRGFLQFEGNYVHRNVGRNRPSFIK